MYKSVETTKSGKLLLSLFVVCCFLLVLQRANAQEIKYPSFLWEISGNGLKKPSYLLGSAHLKDRRLINSNDSLFIAIANTDALALEIHPDSLYKEIWNIRFNKQPASKKIELTDAQKKEFIQRYQKVHGVMPDSQQMASPQIVKYFLNPSHDKPDDITAVLDAYLYGLAKSHRKLIIGLEPMEDQLETSANELVHLKNKKDSSVYYQRFEQLLQFYSTGNLDGLWKTISPYINSGEMQRRNNTMLKNIMAQLDKSTVSVVVGASHLPGDFGLIQLLRNKGYKLRPVKTKKTNLASKYKIDYSTMEWVLHQDSVYGFAVSMPKGYVHKANIIGGTSMMYGDLSTETELIVSAAFVGELHGLTTKEFFTKEYERRSAKSKHRIVSQQFLEKDGAQGMQVVTLQNNMLSKWEFWLKNNTLYSLLAFTNSGQLDAYLSDRFFNGFAISGLQVSADLTESIYDIGAFAVKIPPPAQYIYQTRTEQIGNDTVRYNIYNYFSMDRARKINYIVEYHDYPIGYTMIDRSLALQAISGILEKNPSLNVTSVEPREKGDVIGTAITAQLDKSNLFAEVWVRGNRIYQVMQENLDKNDKEKDQAFFGSFRMIPFKNIDWKDFTLNNIQLKLPVTSLIKIKDVNTAEQPDSEGHIYAATDSNSSTALLLEIAQLPKYYRLAKSDSLYSEIHSGAKKQSEKLLRYDTLISDSVTAAIYTSMDSLTANYHKKIIWIRGNMSYGIDVIGTQEAIEQMNIERIIKSVRYSESPANFDVYGSKAAMLFKDIYSPDTLVARQARNILALNYSFSKDDLPLIYKTLAKKQSDDDQSAGLRRSLIYSLIKNHDERSVPILKNILRDPTTTDLIKTAILPTVCEIDSTQLGWYLEELNRHRPDADYRSWQLLQPLRASQNYVALHLDKIIPLFSVANYRPTLLNICLKIAADSTALQARKAIQADLPSITQYLASDLSELDSGQETVASFNIYSIADYSRLLALYEQKDPLRRFQKQLLADRPTGYLRAITAAEFLALDLPLDQKLIDSIYAHISQRAVLMNALKEKKMEGLIPAKYKEQTEIGKIVVSGYLESEWDISLPQVDYLGELTEKNKLYLVYAYKTEGDEQTYLSIFIPDAKNSEWAYNFENCYSDLEPNTGNWKEKALKLIQEMHPEEKTSDQ
ncbi:TraB/GumN family protein [Sphingobacterium sp.]|uniref:TraB/GumN family protein n=1 Tax=Sphingobacterium sp. TaxID=341027 RepID=UPI0031D253E3